MLDGLLYYLKTFWLWIVDQLFEIVRTISMWAWDIFLKMIEFVISLVNIPASLASGLLDFSGLPAQMRWVLDACGFGLCISMLSSALLIRLLLNLIPSWMTRV